MSVMSSRWRIVLLAAGVCPWPGAVAESPNSAEAPASQVQGDEAELDIAPLPISSDQLGLPPVAARDVQPAAPETDGGLELPLPDPTDSEFFERLRLGYADAQHVMGRRYEHGDGVSVNPQVAVEYYYKSAAQGYAEAQSDLGRMYARGLGIRADMHVAFDWFLRAAEQGLAEAQFNTALILHRGYLGEADAETAADWYWKAAAQSHDGAIVNLSNMYLQGDGIDANADYAYELLRDAAEQGNPAGQLNLARMLMFVDYAAPAEHDVVGLLSRASETYPEEAGLLLGMALTGGAPIEPDLARAAQAYAVAADAGNTEAAYELGEMLLRGEGVEPDPVAAMARFQQAADADIPEAHFRLGALFAEGVSPDDAGGGPDPMAARQAYRVAANADLVPAQYNLGLLLLDAETATLRKEGIDWLIKAAESDHAAAMYQLGLAHQSGIGVPEDTALAAQWYDKAAATGHASARYNRALMLLDEADGEPGAAADRAAALLAEAMLQDHTGAVRVLAGLYADGELIDQDQARARQLYEPLAAAGDVAAAYQLARLYDKADDGAMDPDRARTFYQRAAEAGHLPAQVDLALLLETSDDAARAVDWLRRAAAQDYAAAQYHLGRYHEQGIAVDRNMDEATQWYILAARSGDAQAKAAVQRLALASSLPN